MLILPNTKSLLVACLMTLLAWPATGLAMAATAPRAGDVPAKARILPAKVTPPAAPRTASPATPSAPKTAATAPKPTRPVTPSTPSTPVTPSATVMATQTATAPVSLRFFSPRAYRVQVDMHHKRTQTRLSKAMRYRDDSDMFHLDLPQGLFRKNDPLLLTFHPFDRFNQPLPLHTVDYTVGQTPEYFADTALANSPVRIRTLQKTMDTSPVMHVFVPSAAIPQKTLPPQPGKARANATTTTTHALTQAPATAIRPGEELAARVHRPESSTISFRSLKPVPHQKDWYELQVPVGWFDPGQPLVVDLVVSKALRAMGNTDTPQPAPADMRLLHTFRYETLSNQTVPVPRQDLTQ